MTGAAISGKNFVHKLILCYLLANNATESLYPGQEGNSRVFADTGIRYFIRYFVNLNNDKN